MSDDAMIALYGLQDYVCPHCGCLIDDPACDVGCPGTEKDKVADA